MTLEEANLIYTTLSVKYLDCIPFTSSEELQWEQACNLVFADLRVTNPDMFIDIKQNNKDKYERYRKN